MLGRPILTTEQLSAHVTQLTQQDIIWSPLYDDANYVGTAGQTTINFFAVPQGQGATLAPGASGTKTLQDTNLTAAGQLTKGNAFYMTGQELLFFPGENPEGIGTVTVNNFLNDVYTFGKNGVLTLQVGSNRTYLQDGPLSMFPPATRIAMSAALAGFAVTTSLAEISYGVQSGEVYTIVPLYIEATLGFQEQITWAAAQALPSGNNARIFSRLRGYLNRNAQ